VSVHLKLRPYQQQAIDAVFDAWVDGMRRPAIVLPTGAGKTVVFSHLIAQFRDREGFGSPGPRVIVLVHRDELADQAMNKIRSVCPDLSVGKVKAESNDVHADVMVCSVQTISRTSRLGQVSPPGNGVGLIITDESHHAAAKSYQKVYGAFPDALQLGVTATMERGDGVGLGSTWEDVVYSKSLLWMVKNGFLVSPRAYTEASSGLDLGNVKSTGGDYQAGDLGRALEESDLALSLPAMHKEKAGDRPTVVFTPTVATAQQLSESFTAFGTPAAVVSGETPRDERHRVFEDFRLGRTQVLVNCMVLTEGWDAPWASCAIIARPTRSRSLYQQMVGRVLRPWKGKEDALVINVAGAGGKLCTLVDLEPGVVEEVRDGETLDEAEEREAAEAEERAPRALPISLKETSLFTGSSHAWLETRGGVMFISAGEYTFFLWPSRQDQGSWDVCWMDKKGSAAISPHRSLPLEVAMSWAEAEAEEYGSFSVSRKASWRKGKPSPAQVDFARALGIEPDGMTKAELSDAISVAKESRRLDKHLT
jgi:superfamily II DNA or RNA helicase